MCVFSNTDGGIELDVVDIICHDVKRDTLSCFKKKKTEKDLTGKCCQNADEVKT